MLRKICTYSVLLILIFPNCSAQREDFQTWCNAELSGELFNKIDFSIAPEIRLSNNSTFTKSLIAEIDLSYPVTGFFRIGGQYRIQKKNYIEGIYYMVNRFGIYGKLDFKLDKFRFNYRAIYQQEYEGVNHRENGDISFNEHRHRITLSYYGRDWKLKPKVSYELFLLAKPNFFSEEFSTRLSTGLSYEIKKDLEISIGYKLQKEYIENNPLTSHILALGVSYSL